MKDLILTKIRESYPEPVKRKDLLIFLRSVGVVTSDRKMRKEIELLIERDGECIESSEKGYRHIPNDIEVLNRSVDYIKKKIRGEAIRYNCLIRNFRTKYGIHNPQIKIQFENETV